MLGKLIKYEFKATGRVLLPLYGALIIFAFINKIFMGDFFNSVEIYLGNLPQVIGMFVYIATMVSIFVVTLFIIIQRYRTNLLGDEGYLMNTIPVKPWQNILSKLIVGLVWSMVSGAVAIISVIILAYQKGLITIIITEMPRFFEQFYSSIDINASIIIIEILAIMLISGIASILMIYAALSIGSLFPRRKILASFGAFIVLNMATNIIASIVQLPMMLGLRNTIENMNEFSFAPFHMVILISMAIVIVGAIAYFIISNYILSKKLNLE